MFHSNRLVFLLLISETSLSLRIFIQLVYRHRNPQTFHLLHHSGNKMVKTSYEATLIKPIVKDSKFTLAIIFTDIFKGSVKQNVDFLPA